MITYNWDKEKNLLLKKSRGIDFEESKFLWNDDKMIEIRTSYEDEERFINIGKISTKVYAVVTTYRKENIRIISARRARKKEIEIYES
jgi:uncharacterized DUF497 family protein